jgi:hypothetical protein
MSGPDVSGIEPQPVHSLPKRFEGQPVIEMDISYKRYMYLF